MLQGEQLNLTVDFTNLIAPGDTLNTPTVVIVNEAVNETATTAIVGVPFVTGNVLINVTISSTPLRPGATYVATFGARAISGTGSKNVSALLTIIVY